MFFKRKPLTFIQQTKDFPCMINDLPRENHLNYSNEYPSNFIRTAKYNLFKCFFYKYSVMQISIF